jgi:hypothetical protein
MFFFLKSAHLASRPYQNEFRDTFPDFPVPNQLTSRLVNRFRDTGSVQDSFSVPFETRMRHNLEKENEKGQGVTPE